MSTRLRRRPIEPPPEFEPEELEPNDDYMSNIKDPLYQPPRRGTQSHSYVRPRRNYFWWIVGVIIIIAIGVGIYYAVKSSN